MHIFHWFKTKYHWQNQLKEKKLNLLFVYAAFLEKKIVQYKKRLFGFALFPILVKI